MKKLLKNKIIKIINNENLVLIYIFILSILVTLVYSFVHISYFGINSGSDAGDYISFSQEIARQGWMVGDLSKLIDSVRISE